jgi:hypothetical protein
MAINKRKSRVQPKPAKKSYTKKSVDAAYREVQTKMRKEVTKIREIKPFGKSSSSARQNLSFPPAVTKLRPEGQFNKGIKQLQDIGMKARAKRTKAISAAAKKHGVPKSQITALKPINPGEIASKQARQFRSKQSETARIMGLDGGR